VYLKKSEEHASLKNLHTLYLCFNMQIKLFSAVFAILVGICALSKGEAKSSSILKHIASSYAPIESIMSGDVGDMLKVLSDAGIQDMLRPWIPTTHPLAFDAKETNGSYELIFDVPGVDKTDISLAVKDNELQVVASRVSDKKEGAVYSRVERVSGELSRNIVLPDDCETNKITAESKNGVLIVTIPKMVPISGETDTIKIEVR
jgi:HSP20 family protein